MRSKKVGVFEKASPQVGVALDVGETGTHPTAQKAQVVMGRVGQHGVVQISPEGFDRIQFGGVRRQPLDPQPTTVLLQSVLREAAAVGRKAIPEEENSASPMTPESMQETHEMGAADASRVKGQEPPETPCGGSAEHESDARQALPVERLAQAGRPTPGSPSGANRRPL